MANQISKLLNNIVTVFEDIPLVNTIVFNDSDVIDLEKENIYPLVNIRLTTSTKNENDVLVNIDFEILNQRDFIPKSTPSKLMLDTNYIDNINICDSIGNRFILDYLKVQSDIFLNQYSEFTFVQKDERNALDGVKFNCIFLVRQNGI